MDGLHKQESSSARASRGLLITGRRDDVVFPPSLDNENTGLSIVENEPSGDYSMVSSDFLSLPVEHERVAVSGSTREAGFNCLSNLFVAPDTCVTHYGTEGRGEHAHQQESSSARANSPSRPHTPEQDSSPHLSLEQGNTTCLATSESFTETQKEYRRPRAYKFPDMAVCAIRRNTFRIHGWPLSSPSADEMAKSGMFFQGIVYHDVGGVQQEIHDQVVCWKCGKTIREWKAGDKPAEEHWNINEDCFLTNWEEMI